MLNRYFGLTLGIFVAILSLDCAKSYHNHHWDYLIFTQHWPETVCLIWKTHPNHKCAFPGIYDTWTIHGIWPTITNTEGPKFCNKTWRFEPEQVKTIENDLLQVWTNIEAGTAEYDLWAHEWNKHGTCAASIEPLNSQIKYFSKGIDFIKQYSMTDVLAAGNVLPSNDKPYPLQDYHEAVKAKLGFVPEIMCTKQFEKQYIFELRICFTKTLDMIDCVGIFNRTNIPGRPYITDCDLSKGVYYPKQEQSKVIVQLYKLVTWLQWVTL